jgi:hypothetical protein
VRNLKDLRKFTKAFFCDSEFFPGAGAALASNFSEARCDEAAQELHKELSAPGVLPPLESPPAEDVPAWPLLRLQVDLSTVESVAAPSSSSDACLRMLLEHAVVVHASNRAPSLFGLDSMPPNVCFGALVESQGNAASEQPPWVQSCAEQMLRVARRRLTTARWRSFKEIDGDCVHTPVVTRMHLLPTEGLARFDIFFMELSNPHSLTVAERMIKMSEMFHKRLDVQTRRMSLCALRDEMRQFDKERLPILGEDRRPLHMIHRSILERYMLDRHLAGEPVDRLTLDAFLGEATGNCPDGTFATVAAAASLADAQKAMTGSVRDVFVTEDGTSDSPVVGWLSNVLLTQHL